MSMEWLKDSGKTVVVEVLEDVAVADFEEAVEAGSMVKVVNLHNRLSSPRVLALKALQLGPKLYVRASQIRAGVGYLVEAPLCVGEEVLEMLPQPHLHLPTAMVTTVKRSQSLPLL